MALKFMQKVWHSAARCRLILVFAVTALVLFIYPIQHHISISRFQHWGMAVAVLGCGFLLETVYSFRQLDKWACRCYVSTGLFFSSVAYVLYNNPWLDPRIKVQTAETDRIECMFIIAYGVFCVYLAAVWTKWIIEENKLRTERTQAAEGSGNHQ